MPQKMRVSNQREYNELLKKRGNYLAQVRKLHITLNMMNKEVMAMRYINATSRDSM